MSYKFASFTNCFERPKDAVIPSAIYKPAGFKYGYCADSPMKPSVFFRRSSFGQIRDMLEQGIETKCHGGGGRWRDAAVRIEFVSRGGVKGVEPSTTNSQNLSLFATSSMPYHDGMVVDRTDLGPDLEDVITIASEVSAIIDE